MTPLVVTTKAAPETYRIGQALGEMARGGDFFALEGPLGAGKTQLVKGLSAGLGVPADEPVVSPTFVLVREYFGRLKLYHVDAYRLSDAAELFELGLEEWLTEPGSVVAIEWADRTPEALPTSACRIVMEHGGGDARTIQIGWPSPERRSALEARIAVDMPG